MEVHRDRDRRQEKKKKIEDPECLEEENSSDLGVLKTIASNRTKGQPFNAIKMFPRQKAST